MDGKGSKNAPFLLADVKRFAQNNKSETPGRVMGHAPLLGEHNQEVLLKDLGLRQQDIDRLYQENILYKEEAVDRLPEELKRLEQETD